MAILKTKQTGFFDPFPPEKAIVCVPLLLHTCAFEAAFDVETIPEGSGKCRRRDTFAVVGDTTSTTRTRETAEGHGVDTLTAARPIKHCLVLQYHVYLYW
jgi:hypothetical protein